jgi:hypothetical protein
MPGDHVLEIATDVIGQPQVILYPRPIRGDSVVAGDEADSPS